MADLGHDRRFCKRIATQQAPKTCAFADSIDARRGFFRLRADFRARGSR
jgi:hypothetical protein